MKRNNIIYWTTTGITFVMMLFSGFMYLTNAKFIAVFTHLGFPDYFRVELAIAKIIAAFVLIIPQVPARIKEWAYAGLGISFLSGSIAHISCGDQMPNPIVPLVFLAILIVSNIYYNKQKTTQNLHNS